MGGVAVIAAIAAVGGSFIEYFQNPYLTYALQVLSGNWGGSQPSGVDQYSYVVGAIFAVILNTITIAAIVKGALELTIIRKNRQMNVRNAFNVRDQLAFNKIKAKLTPLTKDLPEAEVNKIESDLWECFIDADEQWSKNFVTQVIPELKI